MIQGMNNQMMMGGGSFAFGFGFQSAASQIQQAPMQQIQQLQGMMKSAFQSFFQAAGQFAQMTRGGFGQSPAASPGFVQAPGQEIMSPSNPMTRGGFAGGMGRMGGGFMAGGFIAVGGQQGQQGQQGRIGGAGMAQSIQQGEFQPAGGLKQEGNTVTTPGGYKIEALGKFKWKITTPEGNKTEISGDPHVSVNGKHAFDFKKNSSFVLGDGTKISVDTTPYGNGATVTKGIHIQSGNQRVSFDGLNTGKITNSGVKNDRYQFDAGKKDGDYFVLGRDGKSWFLDGKKKITGSKAQGAELVVGDQAKGGEINQAALGGAHEQGQLPRPPMFGGQQFGMQMMMQMMQQLMSQMQMFGGGMTMPGLH